MNHAANQSDFDWSTEVERTITHSLITSFGLDFLLVQDKHGGDVDTIHNARSGVYATEGAQHDYISRGAYDESEKRRYHTHDNYRSRGKQDKGLKDAGSLRDAYRIGSPVMQGQTPRDLDHVQSAHEIHNDPGRVLAGLDGVELANQDSNLQSTHSTINRAKKAKPVTVFLRDVKKTIQRERERIERDQLRLDALPRETPQQQHNARMLEDEIRKNKEKVSTLESIDHKAMRDIDKEARSAYNQKINWSYYSSGKFIGSAATATANLSARMGVRQALGMVAAEIWFELRARLPQVLRSLRRNFTLERFITRLNYTLKCIYGRVQKKLKTFIASFQDGAIAGAVSSLTTTVFNIFATTSKNAIKIIRELWSSLVTAGKTLFFNPEKLPNSEKNRKILATLAAGAATAVGATVYAKLAPALSFPFGDALCSFSAALVTGLLTMGLTWTLFHSSPMKKLWYVMDNSAHIGTVNEFKAINQKLDEYIEELNRTEMNLDAEEISSFNLQLLACNNEIERSLALREEIERLNVALPFEMGNSQSTRSWLNQLAKS